MLDSPRKSIQNKAAFADVVFSNALGHHFDGHAVRHQLAVIDVALGQTAKVGFGLDLF